MENRQDQHTLYLTQAAMIAAAYAALTRVFAPISFGAVQLRVAEALTILPLFTPAAVPGLFVGCLLGNILGGAIIWDVIFGSLATLIGAALGWRLRGNRWLVPVPTIIANMVIVPPVLWYGYGIPVPMLLSALYVGIGEVVSCFGLGEALAAALISRGFRPHEEGGPDGFGR